MLTRCKWVQPTNDVFTNIVTNDIIEILHNRNAEKSWHWEFTNNKMNCPPQWTPKCSDLRVRVNVLS